MRVRRPDPPIPHWRKQVPGIPGPYVYEPPCMDDDEAQVRLRAEEAPIPDWTEEGTMIVHEPIARFRSAAEAMGHFSRLHGRLYQNLTCSRFWAARVKRTR